MRKTIFALTVVFLAPTAVMASTSGREVVGDAQLAGIQKGQTAPGSVAGDGQGGSLGGGNVILAKGDQSATGPGTGGQKGQKKGGHKGNQKEGKDNKNKNKS